MTFCFLRFSWDLVAGLLKNKFPLAATNFNLHGFIKIYVIKMLRLYVFTEFTFANSKLREFISATNNYFFAINQFVSIPLVFI